MDNDKQADRPAMLVVNVEVKEEDVDETNRWYDQEHRPDKLALPGYKSMRRFRAADGSPRFLAIYELDRPEAAEHSAEDYHPSQWQQDVMSRWVSWDREIWVELEPGAP